MEFDEYIRLGEPEKTEKSANWQMAIGLQQVDGLEPSTYLIETAKKNIEGYITFDEVKERIKSYYIAKPATLDANERTEEADKVSTHIAEILSEKTFSFSPAEYIIIHKRLFADIYKHAGKIRDYNISKREWVLNGETVYYASADSIRATLDYDFQQEKAFSYRGLTKEQTVEHIAKFVSNIWQIHAFGEGNTRTTAVFIIKYLRTFGFVVNNDLFAENSWYFRNALVRANYNDHKRGIYATTEYLDRFFRNLLLGENNILKNREMCISIEANEPLKPKNDTVNDTVKTNCDTVNVHASEIVFSLIAKKPDITAAKIAEQLHLSIATVKRQIKKLKVSGVIERVGSDKKGYWKVK